MKDVREQDDINHELRTHLNKLTFSLYNLCDTFEQNFNRLAKPLPSETLKASIRGKEED
jgi:hypothetical protein